MPPGDRQPQAGPALGLALLRLLEGLEYVFLRCFTDTGAGVLDAEYIAPVDLLHRKADLPPVGELHGITQQVDQYLAQLAIIGMDRVFADMHVDPPAQPLLLAAYGKHTRDILRQVTQVEITGVQLHGTGLDLGEIQDVVNQTDQVVARRMDRLQGATVFLRQIQVGLDELGITQHRVHRGTNLVGHVREELGLGVAGTLGLFLGDAQRLLRLLAFGDVADDADEDLLPARPRFADGQFHRKGRAVLAPSLHLTPDADDALVSSGSVALQVFIMLLPVRGRHKHLDVPANNFVRTVAEQPLAGRVVFLHSASGIDDHDPVNSCRHQRMQALLTIFQRPRGGPVAQYQVGGYPQHGRFKTDVESHGRGIEAGIRIAVAHHDEQGA